jgi:small-conductance mechanosensitive channel
LASGEIYAASAAAPDEQDALETVVIAPENPGAVMFRGHEIALVRAPIGAQSIGERARAIENQLDVAFDQPDLGPKSVRSEISGNATDLYVGSQYIMSVTDADALPLGRTRRQVVADALVKLDWLRADVVKARSARSLIMSTVWSGVAILLALAAVWAVRYALARAQDALARLASTKVSMLRIGALRLFSPQHVLPIIAKFVRGLKWLLIVTIALIAADFVLNQIPWTQGIAAHTTRVALNALRWTVTGVVSFLPNILYIAVIVVVTRFLLRILRFIVEQLGRAENKFPLEWVRPTYLIVRFVVIALALVVMMPYLPGSNSKAFQGVSVFVGVLVSLGSTAAIANMVSGLVLIYMRALAPGDRVKVADTVGDVITCDLLAMKVRTIKNVDVFVPNSLILSNHIINFSRQAREGRLILPTTVTIGYDADWRRIHELLIAAGKATPEVAAEPQPFVLQTALNDFYVSYELNVYTRNAQAMPQIYSDLHARIHDAFNEAGVEIMSPHYASVRDGNRATVPDQYLPKDYRRPSFGLSWLRPKPASS